MRKNAPTATNTAPRMFGDKSDQADRMDLIKVKGPDGLAERDGLSVKKRGLVTNAFHSHSLP